MDVEQLAWHSNRYNLRPQRRPIYNFLGFLLGSPDFWLVLHRTWQSLLIFASQLRGIRLHFYSTLSAAGQIDFTLSTEAVRRGYTKYHHNLNAVLKAVQQPPIHEFHGFLCHIKNSAGLPHLTKKTVFTSFMGDLNDARFHWSSESGR